MVFDLAREKLITFLLLRMNTASDSGRQPSSLILQPVLQDLAIQMPLDQNGGSVSYFLISRIFLTNTGLVVRSARDIFVLDVRRYSVEQGVG
jgi:hypothetical protein